MTPSLGTLVPFAILLATTDLCAQTQVIPATFAATEAGSSTNFPFGLASPARVQYVYHARETVLTGPMFIQSLNIRADGATAHLQKSNIDLQISLSTTPVTVGTASTTFANNHGADLTVVYTRKLTTLNATAVGSPGQYGGVLTLDLPFFYDPAAGNLIVDFDIASQPTGAWPADTPYTTTGTHVTVGTPCGSLTASSTGGAIGGAVGFTLAGGVANNPSVFFIGTNLFPAPLPLPGSPGCFLYNDIAASLAVTLSNSGTGSVSLNVPPSPGLRGLVLHAQWAALNAGFQFETSATRSVTLSSWSVLRVHNTSTNTSATGTVQNYVGIVIELG